MAIIKKHKDQEFTISFSSSFFVLNDQESSLPTNCSKHYFKNRISDSIENKYNTIKDEIKL